MKLENIIIFRYLKNLRNNKEISGSSIIVVTVIAVSIIFFIAGVSIMNGYIYNFLRIQLEIDSFHIEIPAYTSFAESNELLENIKSNKKLNKMIKFIDLYRENKVLLTANSRTTGIVKFRTLPDNIFFLDHGFADSLLILDGEKNISFNEILISKKTADKLAVKKGDHVYITAMMSDSSARVTLKRLFVAGIFTTGYSELDEVIAYISNKTGDSIFDNETQYNIMIKLNDCKDANYFAFFYGIPKVFTQQFYLDYIVNNINKDDRAFVYSKYFFDTVKNEYTLLDGLKYDDAKRLFSIFLNIGLITPIDKVITWENKNRNMLSALKFEKYTIAFIVILVVIVATLNILSTIYITVFEKRMDIAILKSYGFSPHRVNLIFLLNGIYLSFIGIIIGVFTGLLVMLMLNEILHFFSLIITGFMLAINWILSFFIEADKNVNFEIFSKDFYLNKIYTDISFFEILLISFITLVFSIIASISPAIKAGKIKPIEVIKNG
jgi:ABC-type lipoprotein release transport system permease subunit